MHIDSLFLVFNHWAGTGEQRERIRKGGFPPQKKIGQLAIIGKHWLCNGFGGGEAFHFFIKSSEQLITVISMRPNHQTMKPAVAEGIVGEFLSFKDPQ